jgi:hypothetical protein
LTLIAISLAVVAVFAVAARLLNGNPNGKKRDDDQHWWQAIK